MKIFSRAGEYEVDHSESTWRIFSRGSQVGGSYGTGQPEKVASRVSEGVEFLMGTGKTDRSMIGDEIRLRTNENEAALSEQPPLEKKGGTGVIFQGENVTFSRRKMPCAARITIP